MNVTLWHRLWIHNRQLQVVLVQKPPFTPLIANIIFEEIANWGVDNEVSDEDDEINETTTLNNLSAILPNDAEEEPGSDVENSTEPANDVDKTSNEDMPLSSSNTVHIGNGKRKNVQKKCQYLVKKRELMKIFLVHAIHLQIFF